MALLLTASCAWAQSTIRLRARTIQPERGAAVFPPPAGADGGARRTHYILQFSSYPSPELRQELARRGVRALSYVPDSGLMVSSDSTADLQGLGAVWAGPLEARDKLNPLLATRPAPAYLVVFHPDVEMEEARALARERGFSVLENSSLLPGHLVVTGGATRLEELAASDEVSYILPASTDLAAGKPVTGCAGALTDAGIVGEYATVGNGWAKGASGAVALQYVFESLTSKVDQNTARSEIERAFRTWASNANVSFAAGGDASSARTIAILFASGAHGDGYPFDGPGGVLAHTFYPAPPNSEPLAGDMHFDGDESWRVGADTDLFSVALHEAGHALGLGHSGDPGSVMYPYYHFASGLTPDDIAGIQFIEPLCSPTVTGNRAM